jgi:hypothetical protein
MPRGIIGFALFLLVFTVASHDADACGGFFRRAASPKNLHLALEKALIIYDASTQREHFIREVTFGETPGPFGFVIPTPTRPSIAKFERSPFKTLDRIFPMVGGLGLRLGRGGGGFGNGHGSGGGVTVLEIKKVGSFTSFVLAATDAKALADWLAQNQLVTTPEADVWLAHYVKMKFFYVALRYDPPPAHAQRTKAETVDIDFTTPLPYYPYFEPANRLPIETVNGEKKQQYRLLQLWTITTERVVPVSLYESPNNKQRSWVRPLRQGMIFEGDEDNPPADPLELYPKPPTREPIKDKLNPMAFDPGLRGFLPKTSEHPVVQTFQDQKVSRAGYGDILFVPEKTDTWLEPQREQALQAMLPALDPLLLGSEGDDAGAAK